MRWVKGCGRPIRYGGLMCGALGLTWHLTPDDWTLRSVCALGILLVVSICHLLHELLFKPVYRMSCFYLSLGQLIVIKGVIGRRTQQHIIRQLAKGYFLGDRADESGRRSGRGKKPAEEPAVAVDSRAVS